MLILGLTLVFMMVTSCKKDEEETPALKRVGLVSGIGSLDDKGFNQMAYQGLLNAAAHVELESYAVKVSGSASDIEQNIQAFINEGMDLIIALGYDAANPIKAAALAHPDIQFLLIDYALDAIPANLSCVDFQVDQASFPCGFLAAWRAWQVDPMQPKVCWVGGPKIPTIDQFTQSYQSGVQFFNTLYAKNVMVSGANAGSFTDTLLGSHLADSLMLTGAEVIFACAGKTGNGALYKVKEAGRTAIGVDTDQYLTIPQVGNVLLTSCMKQLDKAVYAEIIAFTGGNYSSGVKRTYDLTNSGVGLAPFHEFENIVPDSIRTALTVIETGISSGLIPTGW